MLKCLFIFPFYVMHYFVDDISFVNSTSDGFHITHSKFKASDI